MVGKLMPDGHTSCGRRGTEPGEAGSRDLLGGSGEGRSRTDVVAIARYRVVATVTLTAASLAFLLNVRDFSAGRELPIAPDDAPAGESSEAKKSNQTHETLTRT